MTQKNNNGSAFTYEEMVGILKGYNGIKNRIMLLEYEIANSEPILTGEDVIYQMALNDLPMYNHENQQYGTDIIALTYAKKADRINVRQKLELTDEVRLLKAQTDRLEYYISLLDERQATVLKQLYFESKTLTETALCMRISESTVKNVRRAGIKKLIEMYSFVSC